MMLCLWDNIFGPRSEQVWAPPSDSRSLHEELLEFCCRHILCDEIDVSASMENFETELKSAGPDPSSFPPHTVKFHVLGEFDVVVCSVVFTARFQDSATKWGLCLFVRRSMLERYLTFHTVAQDHFVHLATMCQYMLNFYPVDTTVQAMTKQLEPFLDNLNAVCKSQLPPLVMGKTYFAFNKPSPASFEFLTKAVSSHLQTHGSSVVIGADVEAVDTMIETLSLFLSADDRLKSSYTRVGEPYAPDLLLQGLLKPEKVSEVDVIQSLLPTTVIDLVTKQITRTHPYHVHKVLRKEYQKVELRKLSNKSDTRGSWASQVSIFTPVKESSPFVENMLNEVFRLPCDLREGIVLQSRRLLVRKAVLLIKYVDARKEHQTTLHNSEIKKLRADLHVAHESDFGIVLAIAERYSPGIYSSLAGDPATIEARFFELFFESF